MAPTTAPAPADPATVADIPPVPGAADIVTIPLIFILLSVN
jgi:hypothetical protein